MLVKLNKETSYLTNQKLVHHLDPYAPFLIGGFAPASKSTITLTKMWEWDVQKRWESNYETYLK